MKKNVVRLSLVALAGAGSAAAWSVTEAPPAASTASRTMTARDAASLAAMPLTAAGLARRWEAIGHLLESSSAARHIAREGSAESRQLQQDAVAARADAKRALDDGELERANALLGDATRLMFAAEQASRSPKLAAEKARSDFAARRESVQSLFDAGRRIAREKGATNPDLALAAGLLGEADRFADQEQHVEALGKLDRAHILVATALNSLRGGEELKVIKFASKVDEYRFELARNDGYLGMVAVVVEGKDSSWAYAAKLGRSLRDEAEFLAQTRNHDAALYRINQSTSHLQSLIRRAGVPLI